MLKWTVQQRRKSAADIGDVLLLGLLAHAPTSCSDVDGIPVRPQPQLRKRGPTRQAAVSSAEPSTPAPCVPLSNWLSSSAPTTRPRSASPRFANAVEESSLNRDSRLVAGLQVVRQCSEVAASAAEDGTQFAASDVSAAARRRFSLTPTVYRRAAAAAREAAAAAVAAAPLTPIGSGCGRSASPPAVAAQPPPRHSPPAGPCLPASIPSASLTADPDAATAAVASAMLGAAARSLGEPELMCVATATSATPKVAKLRRLRPAMQCRRNCLPLATPHEGTPSAAAERGETRRAATPDSGVGVALSEGESVPSDEDAGADACSCHTFASDAHAARRTVARRGSAYRPAPDDYIETDFRIQRSTSDSAAAQRCAAEALRSCSIGRCSSSPRLGDGRERRDAYDVIVPPASPVRPRITFTPAVVHSDHGAAAAAEFGNRRGSLTVVITDNAADQHPLHIPRCLTADASLCRPRALARRRLSDCGRVDREGLEREAGAAGHHVPGRDEACEPLSLSLARQRHLHHLSARDWREVTI